MFLANSIAFSNHLTEFGKPSIGTRILLINENIHTRIYTDHVTIFDTRCWACIILDS